MNKFKKVISLLLATVFLISLSGCQKPEFLSKINLKNIFKKDEVASPVESTTYYNNTDTTEYTEPLTEVIVTQAQTQAPTTVPTTKKPAPSTTKKIVVETGVGSYKSTVASIEQVVYYPNSIKSSNKKLPLLAFANGTGVSYSIYENLIKSIVEAGYIVVANSESMSADGAAQINSIDYALSEAKKTSSIIYNKVNTSQIGVFGHSQGGRSSVNAAVNDSRIKCVLSIAGSNFLEEAEPLNTPVFYITGTKDWVVSSSQWVKPAYDVAKGPAVYASLVDASHFQYYQNPEKISYYCTKWFDAYLKNDKSAKKIFQNGDELSKDSNWTDFECKGI